MTHGVHQVAAGAAQRDAITNHMLRARDVIRGMGLRSEIFVDEGHIDPTLRGQVLQHQAWDSYANADDVAIVHYSIASTAFEYIASRTRRLALHYHNITPAQFLWQFAPGIAAECALGRRRLAELTDTFRWVGADSEFNASELTGLGFRDPQVVGLLRPDRRRSTPSPSKDDSIRMLFVGRGIPNKAQHHLVMALAALREGGAPAILRLAGSWAGVDAYETYCRSLAADLGVAEHTEFLGSVSDDQLSEEYSAASVFVCLSDHEGYCVPLVEAIEAGLPIVAYRAGAVPETTGHAALVLDEKPPSLVAETVIAIEEEPRLRTALAAGREEQLELLSRDVSTKRLQRFVEELA